jgi:hypothetical protein
LRVDIPATWSNPTAQKIILCFTDDDTRNRAAHCIRRAQFAYFESMRLSSQPAGGIQTHELELPGTLGVTHVDGSQSHTQDIKVKEGDDDEFLKSVSVDGEVIVIELKTKTKGQGLRSKRTIVPTVGIPIQFVDALALVIPTRVADVKFTFPDSLQRDLFAYKMFVHSKGRPNTIDALPDGHHASVSSDRREQRANSVTRYFPKMSCAV